MEGEFAERQPLTMEECAKIAEECLTGRLLVSIPQIEKLLMLLMSTFSKENHGTHQSDDVYRLFF